MAEIERPSYLPQDSTLFQHTDYVPEGAVPSEREQPSSSLQTESTGPKPSPSRNESKIYYEGIDWYTDEAGVTTFRSRRLGEDIEDYQDAQTHFRDTINPWK